ncbi:MAG: Mur ligase family protein [Rubricoccaceae bacterium]
MYSPSPQLPIPNSLLSLPRFATSGTGAYRPGLDRMRTLLAAMGDPHRAAPVVHVAGTNGKGSTSSFVSAIGTASSLTTGLHTSPHLVDIGERMRVDGMPAPEAWIEAATERYADTFERIGPSFFEATVALSFLYFAEQAVELAVIEVGLGGRLDATNVVEPAVTAITHIGLDHTDLLGDTLAAVAREKAGIAKPGVPMLHAVARSEAREALTEEAERRGATVEAVRETCQLESRQLVTPIQTYDDLEIGLAGAHQAWNAALAVRAAELAIPDLSEDAVRTGLRDVARLSGLRGRGEVWCQDARVLLDVAHNADGWAAALSRIGLPEGGRLYALVGLMADKDADALARQLEAASATAIPVGLAGDRALPVVELADALRAHGVPILPLEEPTVQNGLAAFAEVASSRDRLLVTGSHLTVAEVLEGQ